jgi:hypothetical protein
LLSVAVYRPTGMVTSPKLMAPFQIARGMWPSLCRNADKKVVLTDRAFALPVVSGFRR